MKIRRIYNENGNISDMSKDRIHLNLSYQEWQKIRDYIEFVRWELPKSSRLQKKATNIHNCFANMEELEPIWINKEGRAK